MSCLVSSSMRLAASPIVSSSFCPAVEKGRRSLESSVVTAGHLLVAVVAEHSNYAAAASTGSIGEADAVQSDSLGNVSPSTELVSSAEQQRERGKQQKGGEPTAPRSA